jgi:hypothetical protein
MTCQWKSEDGRNKCGRNVYGNSEYCIFHKPDKTNQEAAIFWHVLNFDPFGALPPEVKSIFSTNFFFKGDSQLLKHFVKTGICSFALDEPKTLIVDKILENSIEAYLNHISPDKAYQEEILNQWRGSGLHGSNSGFFEGFIFPASGGPFNYKYLLLNQMHTFYFIDNKFEGPCWFEGYDFGNNYVQFVNVKINRQVSFENTVFRRDIIFKNTSLNTGYEFLGKYPFFNANFMGQELKFVGGSIANIYGINISENTNLRIDDDVKIADWGKMTLVDTKVEVKY